MADKKQMTDGIVDLLNDSKRVRAPKPGSRKEPASTAPEPSGETPKHKAGRISSGDSRPRLTNNYQFTSFAVDREQYELIREIARRHGLSYKEVVDAAFKKYIELYEAKNGPIKIVRESNIRADDLV